MSRVEPASKPADPSGGAPANGDGAAGTEARTRRLRIGGALLFLLGPMAFGIWNLPAWAAVSWLAVVGFLIFLLADGLLVSRTRAEATMKSELEAADQQRRQLVADITHELATPLTSIRGYTETLQNPDVPTTEDERQEFLSHILDEARRMELLIQDLFEMARLEAGKVRMQDEPLDWAALCRHTVARFEPKFERAGLSLIDDGGLEEARIEADGRRMEQVLENLLVNAVRYVPEGGTVRVSMSRAMTDQGPGFRLEVRDDGPGFPPQDLEHVFDRFYRGEVTESFPGSGLGLAIVKEIVELQGGMVKAGNQKPTGAVLAVLMPGLR